MSLILATGSNLENRIHFLKSAKDKISNHFDFIAESEIFVSQAVDYLNQPEFYNQVLEFKLPTMPPLEALKILLHIEKELGRSRTIDKGPRVIDIDIIFWGLENINIEHLNVPHPSWSQRSFVVRPLQQLPFFKTLEKCFKIPTTFDVEAKPINLS